MKNITNIFLHSKTLPILAIVVSILFWIVDSSIDVIIFGEDESIIESILNPKPVELWMRCFVVFLLVGFSLFAKYSLSQQMKITDKLNSLNEQLQKEIVERKNVEKQLEELAATDPLTSLYNRRKFNEVLQYEIERDRRYKCGLSLILCDIDHFKQINDNYGHDIGDKVLTEFAEQVKTAIREADLFARWGGEEFAILIPNSSSEIAISLAEKIRIFIENSNFSVGKKVTASFGVSILLMNEDRESLIKRADHALYTAKEKGRNLVVYED